MKWTKDHDDLLVKEILLFEPYTYKEGTLERGNICSNIAESLNQVKQPAFSVTKRSVRDRYNLLASKHKKKRKNEERASGISPEDSELSKRLQDLEERFEQTDSEFTRLSNEKKQKAEEDVAKAEEFRKVSMERLGESQKRERKGKGKGKGKKRARSSGSEVLSYLKEKAEKQMSLKDEEREGNKRFQEQLMKQQQQFMTCMQNSNQQMQQVTLLMTQQQQQQSAALLKILDKFADK